MEYTPSQMDLLRAANLPKPRPKKNSPLSKQSPKVSNSKTNTLKKKPTPFPIFGMCNNDTDLGKMKQKNPEPFLLLLRNSRISKSRIPLNDDIECTQEPRQIPKKEPAHRTYNSHVSKL